MKSMPSRIRQALMAGCAVVALAPAMAAAQEQAIVAFDIPAQDLDSALTRFGQQAGREIIISAALTKNRRAPAVQGKLVPEDALRVLLADSGLMYRVSNSGSIIVEASAPQSGSAAGDGADAGTVQAIVVTAQKREENIQDVPIAMSAFTQEDLTRSQVATGADLMTQVPNMTFTKTNFTSYSIQIRGIGTQAISATVDPAVAVAFNNTPFLRAHFFEQEFYDLERVEVLRGPQGTLYGRNATAGVVNLISAKPKFHFEAKASADVGNYSSTRLEGMLNLPLVEDKAALRIAGAWTKRDGFVTNQNTGKQTDGRDLWATRVSLRLDPTETLRTNFIWEHFEEDDDRLRSGKQTCNRAHVPATIDGVSTNVYGNGVLDPTRYLDQGCNPASLYASEAYQTPDGHTLAFYLPLGELGASILGNEQFDVYASTTQSRDVRVIESQVDPRYRASSDTLELNLDYDLTPSLTISSQTGYNRDFLFSTQDYNRFNTKPGAFVWCDPQLGSCRDETQINNRNEQLTRSPQTVYGPSAGDHFGEPCGSVPAGELPPNAQCYTPGIFCDPQIGCSDRLVLMDLATATSRQLSQEVRLSSNFDGPFNFSVGANYLRYKTLEDYYVFINSINLMLAGFPSNGVDQIWQPGISDDHECMAHGFDYQSPFIPRSPYQDVCAYIDPNPVTNLNGQGHNYFRNQNPYKVQSYALFGEAYYNITPDLKLTAGLRWTVDRKKFISIPSELLVTGYGYPSVADIKQEWREPTGRLVLTWTPTLGFTDQSMFYTSYTHGYKAGGANPPGAALLVMRGGDIAFPIHPPTFKPEFVEAYEAGTKNTLLGGRLTANLTGFYYDYTGYQISEIVDRSAINLNFDAKIWGVELEADWRPLENLRLGLKGGYEDTRMADGSKAVDLMDRTAGREGWMVVKPFPTQASNCILPTYVVAAMLQSLPANIANGACSVPYLGVNGQQLDPVTGLPYMAYPTVSGYGPIPDGYKGFDPTGVPNRGAGFDKDLSGHALPNAPKYTVTLTADYTLPLPQDWLLTLHGDFYQQSEAWTRVFNDPGYDKLKAYNNINLAAIFTNEDRGWTVMAYVKNVLDKDNITGAFLNSDDTGLTTNIFLNEPRLYGLRVTKNWSDSPWWSAHANSSGYYPLRVELEGYHGRTAHGHELYEPGLNLTPDHRDLFSSDMKFPTGTQNDLAGSNGGGVKFIYQPSASAWSIAAAVRYGRAGGGTHRIKDKDVGNDTCLVNGKYCWNPSAAPTDTIPAKASEYGWHSYYETTTQSQESHTFADFTVGKDFGLGRTQGRSVVSTFSGGIGYARFKSMSDSVMHGSPDMYFPENTFIYDNTGLHKYSPHFHRFSDNIRADRMFEGAGPEVNWEGEIPLLGTSATDGRIGLDLGVGGVVLFGKQKAELRGRLEGFYAQGNVVRPAYGIVQTYNQPLGIPAREKSATVPGIRANLGLSYTVQGLKVSGGYRVERYYNAIDGGIEERKTYDRSFEGPYMKVSIGFGG